MTCSSCWPTRSARPAEVLAELRQKVAEINHSPV